MPPSRRAGRPAASEWIEPDQFEPHWIQPKEPRLPVVIVPEAYRGPTQGVARIDVDADTVRAALESVERAHPGFFDLIVDGSGRQHRFVKLFINEEQLAADALDTPLGSDDRLEVLAAIAGG